MSGLYLNPYRGYEGNPGNNGGLSIPHRSKYNCSSNLRIENEKGYRTQHVPTFALSLSFSHSPTHAHTPLYLSLLGKAIVGQAIRQGRYVTYKRVEGVAVGRDRDDKDCRPQDPRQKPVERGPDGVQAGTVENRNGPAIRKQRQLRCACWYPRVSQSCTTKESPLVFFRASIVPEISICLFVNPCRHPPLLSRAFAYIRSDRTPRWGGEEEAVARDYSP